MYGMLHMMRSQTNVPAVFETAAGKPARRMAVAIALTRSELK